MQIPALNEKSTFTPSTRVLGKRIPRSRKFEERVGRIGRRSKPSQRTRSGGKGEETEKDRGGRQNEPPWIEKLPTDERTRGEGRKGQKKWGPAGGGVVPKLLRFPSQIMREIRKDERGRESKGARKMNGTVGCLAQAP